MARIALVDASAAIEAAVRAALGDGVVTSCASGAVPDGVDLVIQEISGAAPPEASGATPRLLLVERGQQAAGTSAAWLEKPFRPKDLRIRVQAMLNEGAAAATGLVAAQRWLTAPRLAAPAAAALARARRLGGVVWMVGEDGTGAAQIAAALAAEERCEPVVWADTAVVPAAAEGARMLWVPDLERRPASDQHAFERFLALDPQALVLATCSGDPEALLEAGRLTPGLHAVLSRNSLRLPPLRERRSDILPLAAELLAGPAARLGFGRATLAADAARLLEAFDWPGNVLELEAVLVRSLVARAADGALVVELAAADLRFAPDHLAPLGDDDAARPAAARVEPQRRGVVVPLADASRRSAETAPAPAAAVSVAARGPGDAGVEALLAAFAHEIRNPMSTIKTFASLEAARAGDDTRELAALALEASARIDEQLEFLQRYAELAPASAERVDLVEILAEAGEAAGFEQEIAARRPVPATADPDLVRFVADALVAELRTRAGAEPPRVDAARTGALTITTGGGTAAVDRLNRWVEGTSLPWRLALARAAARRAGGDLEVDVEDGELRLLWRAPSASGDAESEERKHDDQAGSPDRRRRSRGS